MNKKITIGVTDCSKYENYAKWIQAYGKEVEVVKLSEKINNIQEVQQCHGVLFTGGEDVHPRFYNKPEYLKYCHQDDVNEKRDEFEMNLMNQTEKNHIPVLGICRGLQIFNVYKAGTLIPDIPSWGKPSHSKNPDGTDCYHSVQLISGSWLESIVGKSDREINSNHHQSADRIGEDLIVSALSEDGIVEALDRKDPDNKGFLCLVQWHPERMKNQQSGFVHAVREAFIKASSRIIL